jgi:hypothetical protein
MVVATVLIGDPHERAKKETRTFRTVTRGLIEMREWFLAKGVTHVALESTGIYGEPIYIVLEDTFEVIVGNAHHQERAGPEDGRTSRTVSGWPSWPGTGSSPRDSCRSSLCGNCGLATLPAQAGGEPDGRAEPPAEAARDHEHQARQQ